MNKKICFYAPPFSNIKSHHEKIDAAAKYSITGVEAFNNMEFSEPNEEYAKKLRSYADSQNVICPCFSLYVDFSGDDSKKAIEDTKKYANIAKILGSPYLHHTIIAECMDPDKVLPFKNEYYKKGISAVREIYDYAESIGIKTIYEDQGFIFNGIEWFGNFLADVNRDVGVVADFGNILQADAGIIEFIHAFSDKICHVHLKDGFIAEKEIEGMGFKTLSGNYTYETQFGEGKIDLKGAIKVLKDIGYDGYYAMEFGAADENGLVKLLNSVNDLLK